MKEKAMTTLRAVDITGLVLQHDMPRAAADDLGDLRDVIRQPGR
jgi:hypothetical protein